PWLLTVAPLGLVMVVQAAPLASAGRPVPWLMRTPYKSDAYPPFLGLGPLTETLACSFFDKVAAARQYSIESATARATAFRFASLLLPEVHVFRPPITRR